MGYIALVATAQLLNRFAGQFTRKAGHSHLTRSDVNEASEHGRKTDAQLAACGAGRRTTSSLHVGSRRRGRSTAPTGGNKHSWGWGDINARRGRDRGGKQAMQGSNALKMARNTTGQTNARTTPARFGRIVITTVAVSRGGTIAGRGTVKWSSAGTSWWIKRRQSPAPQISLQTREGSMGKRPP